MWIWQEDIDDPDVGRHDIENQDIDNCHIDNYVTFTTMEFKNYLKKRSTLTLLKLHVERRLKGWVSLIRENDHHTIIPLIKLLMHCENDNHHHPNY